MGAPKGYMMGVRIMILFAANKFHHKGEGGLGVER